MEPTTTQIKLASIQVCVPKEYTDKQTEDFADKDSPTGLDHGWAIRREGHEHLNGSPERVSCDKNDENVHVTLDC